MKLRTMLTAGVVLLVAAFAAPVWAGSYELITKDPDGASSPFSGFFGEVAVGGGGSTVALLDCVPTSYLIHPSCRLLVADRARGALEEAVYTYPLNIHNIWDIRLSDDGSILAAWVDYDGWPSREGILVHNLPSNSAFVISGNGNFAPAKSLALSGDGSTLATFGDPYYFGIADSATCTELIVFPAVPNPQGWSCVRMYDGMDVEIGTYAPGGYSSVRFVPGTYALNYDGTRVLFTSAATGVSHKKTVAYAQLAIADLADGATYLLDSNQLTRKSTLYDYRAGGLSNAGTEAVYTLNGEVYKWPTAKTKGNQAAPSLGAGSLGMIDASGDVVLYRGGATGTDLILSVGGAETLVAPNVTAHALDKGGSHAVFVTSESLVPEDTDSLPDVYLFEVAAP